MKKLKVKIITGFRKEQHYTIDADEAHKAYYLFLNPDKRGVFNNGVAILGQDIRAIEPDYNATMGWNETHPLDEDDLNEIRQLGVGKELRSLLISAREMAQLEKINQPLTELIKLNPPKYPELSEATKRLRE